MRVAQKTVCRWISSVIACCLFVCGGVQAQEIVENNTSGYEFILVFQPNYYGSTGTQSLFIAAKENTQGVVEIPGLGFSANYIVLAGQVTTVNIPSAAQNLPNNQISERGIRVTADAPVHVYGLNRQPNTTDAFLGLPVHVLGTDYLVMSYYGLIGSQLAVVGIDDNTEVTITPSATVANRPAGQPFTIKLNRLQTFQLEASGIDLTGTLITSNAPIAVAGGVRCAYVPKNVSACDHIIDMMPPLTAWGKLFVTYPLATRKRGDFFRVLASVDGTRVHINGEHVATLNRGGYFDDIITTASHIEASEPVLLAQYSVGQSYDGVVSDPFMMLVPPSEQFLDQYVFTTPSTGFNNFVNVVIPTIALDSIRLDGQMVDPDLFHPVGDSGYSGAQFSIKAGSHHIEAETSFGIYVYGFASYDSYGYAGGMAFNVINPIHGDYQNVRVISYLAAEDIEIDQVSFTHPPARIDEFPEYIEIEWRFDQFLIGQIEELDFDLSLLAPIPGEQRLVSHRLELIYDDIHGNTHHHSLGEQYVNVLSSWFQLGLSLDKAHYTVGEMVTIYPALQNLASFDAEAELSLSVRDAQGQTVATLDTILPIPVEAGEALELPPELFDTTAIYAGEYSVHALLTEQHGRTTSATAAFQVTVPEGTGLSANVATDQERYQPHDWVTISSRLLNTTPNSQLDDHTIHWQVFAPDDSLFWQAGAPLRSLAPGGRQELSHTLEVGSAASGHYRVHLTARDPEGVEQAAAETIFEVASTAETGAGLSGSVYAVPTPVYRYESVDFTATLANLGNAALHDLPVTLTLIEPAGEQVLAQWQERIDLPVDGEQVFSTNWLADLPLGSVVMAVLQVEIGGETKTLAHTSVPVVGTFNATPRIEGHGRLLVLLDPPASGQCSGIEHLHFTLAQPMVEGDTLQIELYDPQGQLLDTERAQVGAVIPVDLSSGHRSNLILTELHFEGAAIEIRTAGQDDTLQGGYRLYATLWRQDVGVAQFNSGLFESDCLQHPESGTHLGDFLLSDIGIVQDGPDAERRYHLEQLLRENGWSHTIVTNPEAFAGEFRRGGYSAYLLLASTVKLNNQISRELREAIHAGRGLVMAGIHDQRNHHLLAVSGVELVGVHAQAMGLEPLQDAPLFVPALSFTGVQRPLAMRLAGAQPLAEYHNMRGHPDDHTAIAVQQYGQGYSLIAGFDLLEQSWATGEQSDFSALLLDALTYTHPDPVPNYVGMTVPVRWRIENLYEAADIRLHLEVEGGRIVDPGPCLANGPRQLICDLTIESHRHSDLHFWWQLPDDLAQATISAHVYLHDGHVLHHYRSDVHHLALTPLPGFEEIRHLLHSQGGDGRVLQAINQAEAAHDRGDPEQAIFHLLRATDYLDSESSDPARTLRIAIAWLIHRLADGIAASS